MKGPLTQDSGSRAPVGAHPIPPPSETHHDGALLRAEPTITHHTTSTPRFGAFRLMLGVLFLFVRFHFPLESYFFKEKVRVYGFSMITKDWPH